MSKFISSENLLKLSIAIAGSIMGTVIVLNTFQYEFIPLTWKIAVSTFILILPISFFMQAKMMENTITDERISGIKFRLLQVYSLKKKEFEEIISRITYSPESLWDNYRKISVYLDTDLREYYRRLYEYLVREEENSKESLQVIKLKRQKFIGFDIGDVLQNVVHDKMRDEGIDFRSYLLPLSFFMLIYFSGILVTIPLLNSVFTGVSVQAFIPLFDEQKWIIPILVIEWGFIGGLVYTSINLLYRFLRGDLLPKVYLYGSFRLIYATVASIVIYFSYLAINPDKGGIQNIGQISPSILLLSFSLGIAPIQFLLRSGQSVTAKVMNWKGRGKAGNRNISVIEGINLGIVERLSEEGIDSVQQLAFCKVDDLAEKTKFPTLVLNDWKDQALLYLFTSSVKVLHQGVTSANQKENLNNLNQILVNRLGIRTYSGLKKFWSGLKDTEQKKNLFSELKLFTNPDTDAILLVKLFDNLLLNIGK
jgi:hypothetical protein